MKDGKCILQYNKKNGYVYVSYREIWKFFESFFSMSNQQIQDITKIWVEEHYKMGVTSTRSGLFRKSAKVEEYYKMGVTSTDKKQLEWVKKVEEHYEMGVTKTTTLDKTQQEYSVEEHYENKIQTTNDQNKFYFERDVEELYNQHTNG